jgi:predicted Zn-dependent peptidase
MIHKISKTHSKLSTIVVAFDAGYRSEKTLGCNKGVSHMLEHCIFKGTANRTAEQINREIAHLGGHSNALTSFDIVQYYITAPTENIEKCTEILSDMVFNPLIPEDEFIKEKEVVKEEELSTNDSIYSYMFKSLVKEFFSNYLAEDIIGNQESISKFTREELIKFHSTYYNKDWAIVSLCSNMNKRDAKCMLEKYFGKPSGRIRRFTDYSESEHRSANRLEITKSGIEHTYVSISFPISSSLMIKKAEKTVLDGILSMGMDSRLFSEVREKRGLVYGVSGYSMLSKGGGIYSIDFSTRDKNVEEAISVIKDELLKIKSDLVSDEELVRSKNKIKTSLYASNENSQSPAFYEIQKVLNGSPSIEEYIQNIDKINSADIKNIAENIFNMDKMFVLVCRKE